MIPLVGREPYVPEGVAFHQCPSSQRILLIEQRKRLMSCKFGDARDGRFDWSRVIVARETLEIDLLSQLVRQFQQLRCVFHQGQCLVGCDGVREGVGGVNPQLWPEAAA